jgi:glycerophosphoryl diester phosphodiesterase
MPARNSASHTTPDLSWLRRSPNRPPVVVAHRGASGLAPENTLAAFKLAVDLGTPAVECDVHLTSDGQVIVIHDATVNRTTNGAGEVATQSFAALRALDAGGWLDPKFAGEKLPSLDETLAACTGKSRLFLEIKRGGGAPLVQASLAAVERATGTDVAIISFGPEEVEQVARVRPDLPLGFLVGKQHVGQNGAGPVVEAARKFGATFVSPQHDVVDAEFVRAAHNAGLPVSVWTVDDTERMQVLADLGVDAITTNRPDLALQLFR